MTALAQYQCLYYKGQTMENNEFNGYIAKVASIGCVTFLIWLVVVALIAAGGIWLIITVLRALGVAI